MLTSIFKFIKKLCLIALCLAALVTGLWFAFENPQKIAPLVYGYSLPELALGFYIAAVMLLGIFVGFAVSYWGSQFRRFKLKSENNRLKKKLQAKEQKRIGEQKLA